MKKLYLLLLSLVLIIASCNNDDPDIYRVIPVTIQLKYPANADVSSLAEVSVQAKSSLGNTYTSLTDANGRAMFQLPVGIYEINVTDKKSVSGKHIIFSGSLNNFAVTDQENVSSVLSLLETQMSQVIIKELYVGGCQKNDGSGSFHFDKYVILYNNSDDPAQLQNICLGITIPYNSTIANADVVNGSLFYESEGWIPAGLGFFYFPNSTIIEPRQQVVVAFNNANDNTQTYSNSVDLSSSEYYVTYAPEAYTNINYHPAPSSNISTSHYLSGFRYGTGNAWAVSNTSPAFFLFAPEGVTPQAFNADADNVNLYNGSATQVRKKVSMSWVVDAIEVFNYGASNNSKRFPTAVDGGSISLSSGKGYTLYRNVDKEATEAIASNKGKIVYQYSLGTKSLNGTTDESGIDAEQSIRNGATIVYMDTNNSSNDFHQRAISSLK